MSSVSYYSPEGLKKLKDELAHLEQVERPRVSQEIADARDKGDLSENAEYDAAKEAQGMLEMKISKLEDVLANARILSEENIDLSKVGVLNNTQARSFCGSPAYLAPEMLRRQGHGKSVDWYLLGVLLYEMLVGIPPYYSNNKD